MKLRTKVILFFGAFLLTTVAAVTFYAEYVVGDIFKKQTTDNFRIIAEQSESSYLSFLGSMKVRVIDWTSDNTLRGISKSIITTPVGTPEHARLAKEFASYVGEKKMPYDKTIVFTDLLDRNGIVVASTRPGRIGQDEKDEEAGGREAHNFTEAINAKPGEVFFGKIVFNAKENPEPTINATVRLFELGAGGQFKPLDAVLLVYFENTNQIAEALGDGASIYAGVPGQQERLSARALFQSYQTSDIYLVNSDHIMVTHSRSAKNQTLHVPVNSLPVTECFDNGKEVSAEYDNYKGIRVIGSSMCFPKEGVVIMVEINKDEVYAPLRALTQSAIAAGIIAITFGIIAITFFIRRPLARVDEVIAIAREVSKGNLDTSVKVTTHDELGYLGTVFNTMISAVRDNQKYLREAKHRTEQEKARDEALLASIGEGMIATDKAGNIIAINRMAEKMLGLKSVDVIGKDMISVVEAVDDMGKELPRDTRTLTTSMGTTTISTTMHYRKKNDGYFPVSATVTPIIYEDNIIGSISIFRDITKEKELEKTREDLLSLASHQLRTPLSGTKWLIETLKRGLKGPLSPGQTEYIDELYKINERMTSLVHEMLGVLRLEQGAQAKKESSSVKGILTAVFESLSSAAEGKQIAIRLPDNMDYTIETDAELLRNILESIVANAINYSNPNNEVILSVKKNEKELAIAIKDFGIGIPADEHPRLYERFYRATNAKTFDTRGSGLGLYIADLLAKKIGVTLSFESEEGKGTTFYVHIPSSDLK